MIISALLLFTNALIKILEMFQLPSLSFHPIIADCRLALKAHYVAAASAEKKQETFSKWIL